MTTRPPKAGMPTTGFLHEGGRSRSTIWLTPPEIIRVLGPFDLDPCAAIGQPWRTARQQYTVHENGLRQPWTGFVWCNPPFGPHVQAWLIRMAEHRHGIVLVPARTETKWFIRHIWQRADGIHFMHGRVRFHHITGQAARGTLATPTCLVAYGPEAVRRLRTGAVAGTFTTWETNHQTGPLNPRSSGY